MPQSVSGGMNTQTALVIIEMQIGVLRECVDAEVSCRGILNL